MVHLANCNIPPAIGDYQRVLTKLLTWIFLRPCPSCGELMLRRSDRCDGCVISDERDHLGWPR